MSDPTVAVVMPVYSGTSPAHFRDALASLLKQSRAVEQIVVVADGPLTDEHESSLQAVGSRLRLVRLPQNVGGARARQAGISETDAGVIVMADADDISLPHRVEMQLQIMLESNADLIGAAMEEFDDVTGSVLGVRRFPSEPTRVAQMMKSRNPINHPTVVVRREAIVSVGGYRDLPYLEDYDLWARMLSQGYVLQNSPEVLVRYRGGLAAQSRRRVRGYVRHEINLQRHLREYGLISTPRAALNLLVRVAYRLIPSTQVMRVYSRVFLQTPKKQVADERGR